MLKQRYAIAASAGLIFAAFAVYYSVQAGGSDRGYYPQVPGRLVSGYVADASWGGFIGHCEFDALVEVAPGNVVTEVVERGSQEAPAVGAKVIGTLFVPDVAGRGEGPSTVEVGVYWGEDGNLYAGCAPESMAELDDGTWIRITDLPKYGSTPPAAR